MLAAENLKDGHGNRLAVLADDVPAGIEAGVGKYRVNASDGLRVGGLIVFAAIFLCDGVEAVELHGFKWIVRARPPDAIAY